MDNFLIYLVFIVFIITTLSTFFISVITSHIPSVKQLRKDKRAILNIVLSETAFIKDEKISKFTKRKITEEILNSDKTAINNLESYLDNYTIGQIIKIVEYYEEKRIENIVKKLKEVGFIILIFGGVSILMLLGQAHFSINELFKQDASNVFKILAYTQSYATKIV